MRQAEKETKKNLLLNSVHTRLGQENSEQNRKKIEKIKKPLSDIISSQNGMRQDEKEKKKFYFRILFKPDSGKKIPKKIAKKLEKLKKPHSDINFSQNGMRQIDREREKKNLLPNSVHTRPRQENSKKIAKKLKKLKNLFLILFLATTG